MEPIRETSPGLGDTGLANELDITWDTVYEYLVPGGWDDAWGYIEGQIVDMHRATAVFDGQTFYCAVPVPVGARLDEEHREMMVEAMYRKQKELNHGTIL